MKHNLFKKFFATIAVIIVVSFTITAIILSFAVTNYFSKEKYSSLVDNCNSVASIAVSEINSTNFKRNIFNVIRVQNSVSDVDTFITDPSGNVIICGCKGTADAQKCMHENAKLSDSVLAKARSYDYFAVSDLNNIYSETHYTVGIPIMTADSTLCGYVFSSSSTKLLHGILLSIFKMYLFSAIIPLLMMFVAVYTMTYRLTKPLKLMSDAAKSMANGDFSKRIPVISDDEIGELSISFNNMANSLTQLEDMRRSFVANVSHELRTPMTTISGFIDGIIDGTITPDKQGYYLSVVSEETKRLSRVVQSMLSLAKLESGETSIKPSRFDLSQTVVNVVISRERQIEEKNINISGLDTLENAFVFADNDLIYQVVYNLVDNAVKFTDDGGTIEFALYNNANSVELKIKNTGIGISKENIDKIFDRFYKVDKSRSSNKNSTGLGLYIAKTIVDIHGGKITASSVENEFAVFSVTLPSA